LFVVLRQRVNGGGSGDDDEGKQLSMLWNKSTKVL